jgi:hypothetical protein
MELEITFRRTIRIWWAYLWRNLIAILVTVVVGFIVGFILGFIMGMLGFSVQTIQLVTAPIGFLIGLAISIVPLWMILGKDFGEFRLVLLANEPAATDAYSPHTANDVTQPSTLDQNVNS